MKREAVVSSNIKSVGYDIQQNVLEVEFANGSVYQYKEVPKDLADQFVKSESAGRFFSQNVRNQFQATRVEAA